MKHFTIMRGYIVNSNDDGSVGLNAHIYAALDTRSEGHLERAAALVRQANACELLHKTLQDIEMETRSGAQWTLPEINEAARAALARIQAAESPKVSP